jgi:hypothetical protein
MFEGLNRLQRELQEKLSGKPMRDLRRFLGSVAPASPGTVVQLPHGTAEVSAQGRVGEEVALTLTVRNFQRVACQVSPQLTPLISEDAQPWSPRYSDATCVVPSDGAVTITLRLVAEPGLKPGTYRGELVLLGFAGISPPVSIVLKVPTAGTP